MTDPRDAEVTGALAPQAPVRTETLSSHPDGGRPRRPPLTKVREALDRLPQTVDGVPLRARLVGILVVLLLLALAAIGFGVQYATSRTLVNQIDSQLDRVAGPASTDTSLRLLNNVVGHEGGPSDFVVQVTVDGSSAGPFLNGGYRPWESQKLPTFPVLTSTQADQLRGRTYTVQASDGTRWRATSFASPIDLRLPTGDSGPAAVTIAVSLGRVDDTVAWLRLFTVMMGALLIVFCGVLGWLAIRRSFRPLVEVEETAAAIAAGDLSRRIPERPASTEVGRLTRSLNGMLTQIESAFRAREASEARTRRFAADASHELRTPLVSIRGFAELYRQGAVPDDEVPRTMRRIEDEAKRMGSLVEDLLLLARLDEQRPGRHDPVDLAVLAGDAVHDARGLDADRTVTLQGLGAGGPRPAVVVGDEDRLRQVVANLVANAVRHTPAGTPIEVAVGRDGDAAVLEVRDHGQGLTPEQAPRVFERFYRLDSSRQRGTGGGSGLGLSIVAAVVASHAGRVDVLQTPGGGATFRVVLPAAAVAEANGSPRATGWERPEATVPDEPGRAAQTPSASAVTRR